MPVKKPAGASSSDRSTKPTAASLSRTRSPAAAQPAKPAAPARTAATPRSSLRGAPAGTTPGTPSRGGKVPATPSKTKKAKDTPPAKSTQETVIAGEATIATAAPLEADADVFSAGGSVEEKPVKGISPPPEPEVKNELTVEEDQPDDSTAHESEPKIVVSDEEDTAHDEGIASPQPDPQPQPTHESEHGSPNGSASAVAVQESTCERPEESPTDPIADKLAALASRHDSTDIEQIVNLLETGPAARAASDNISTPSDIQEIPDEEH